jgi:thiol-disulfide isomerase/thioredoxin
MSNIFCCFAIVPLFAWLLLSQTLTAQTVEVVKFDAIAKLLTTEDDTVRVLNFWATWCKPCIEELPAFDSLASAFADKNVKVVMVSLDFLKDLPKVAAFVKRRGMIPKVLLLDGGNPNNWIDNVSPDWSGAIPATMMMRGETRSFFEREMTFAEMREFVETNLRQ